MQTKDASFLEVSREYAQLATGNQAAIDAAVQQIINAATTPIKQAQTTYDAQSGQQQKNVTGLTDALAGILQGIAPGVNQTYADAATRQAAFARGFSDHMQAAQQQRSGDTSSFLQDVVGAPSSQISQVQGQVNPAGAADTLYGIRGYIPASTLNEEGAAYTANAQQLPAIANAQGLQQIGKVQADQRAQDAKFAQDIAAEAGKAPQYRQQIANDLFNQQYKTNAQKLEIQKIVDGEAKTKFDQKYKYDSLNATQAYRQVQADFKQAGLRLATAKYNLSVKKALADGAKPNATWSRIMGYVVDGNLDKIPGANGKAIPVKQRVSGGLSTKDLLKARGNAAAIAEQAFTGISPSQPTPPKGFKMIPLDQAWTLMQQHGVPDNIARAALRKAGYTIPTAQEAKDYKQMTGVVSGAPLGGPYGKVAVAPGADRAGASTNPAVKAFVARVSGLAGTPLTITTGTNHNEYVLNTRRVSDHWAGNAADIAYGHGSPGKPDPALTRLGQDALVAAGADPAWARKQTGGLFNLGPIQIIFNSMEGGNHFNHLHVGVR